MKDSSSLGLKRTRGNCAMRCLFHGSKRRREKSLHKWEALYLCLLRLTVCAMRLIMYINRLNGFDDHKTGAGEKASQLKINICDILVGSGS